MVMEITGNVNSCKLPLEATVVMFKSTEQSDAQVCFMGDKDMPEEQE